MSLAKDAGDLPSEVDLAQLKEELSKHGVVMCPAPGCDQDFRSLWGLKYHLKQNNHENTPERKFKCEQCNLSFQSRITLRQHRTAKHGSSESGIQSSSSCSRDKGSFHFDATSRGGDAGDATTREVKSNQDLLSKEPDSRHSGLQESSRICSSKDSCTDFTGAPKRKRGQEPMKTVESVSANGEVAANPSCENPHLDASCLSQAVSVTKILSSSKSEIKTSTDVVTLRRTSTRVKTPRRSFYEEVLEGERLCNTSGKRMLMRKSVGAKERDKGSEKGTPEKIASKTTKKRARKPKQKFNTPENDVNVGETPVKKKRGRKRKDVTPVKIDISYDNETDHNENCDTKEKWEGTENKGNNGDREDGGSSDKPRKPGRKSQHHKTESDGDESATKKKQGRTKAATCSEVVRLKKYLRYGQKLSCENEGCGAKFTTALGYLSHKKICGVKEEDREKFVCEECGKEYTSMPGLSYHLKAKHTQTEPVESDNIDNADKEVEDPEITQARRARRKAASRALSKVQQLVTDNIYEETKPGDAEKLKRKYRIENSVLDKLLTTTKGRVISKEQEDKWTEKLETQPSIVCPCKGCSKTFPSVFDVKKHLETCEKAVSYKCLACSKTFAAQLVARNHVKFWHVGFTPVGKDKSDSSDTDFQLVSSGDSEQESDDIEIEEIEEDDSIVDEECDEEEEIFVWDDKRKKYKKKKSKQTRTFVRGFMKVDPFGEDDKDFFSATQKWHQEVHKHKDLFPNFRPMLSHWSKVRPCEINQYLPEAVVSPQFTVKRKDEDQGNQQDVHVQLPLFGSTSKDNSSVYGDVTFNVGGPVWAMDWCPVPDSRKNAEQFLAISTHRSLDQVHSIHKTISSKGLIQLWHVGQLNVDSASSGSKPTLSLGIAHNYGTIWDISWCPSGTWDLVSSKKIEGSTYLRAKGDELPRLGVLAIACSDGLVRIISIPWPSELFSVLETEEADSTVIVHGTPHAVLMPCALGVEYDGQCGQAWCVKWCPHSMHDKIATGFSDGTVAIWNLLSESVLLKELLSDERQTFRLSPFLHVVTNSSVVRDLAWCPQNPNIIVTGSYDRHHKLWNMKTVHTPITSLKRGIPLEIHWPLSYGNIVSCEDDCFQTSRCPNIMRNISFTGDSFTITSHNSIIWSTSTSDWCKLSASGDAAGEVEGVYLKKSDKKFSKFGIYRVCLEKSHHDLPHPGNENGNQDEECDTRKQEGQCNDSLKEHKVSVELDDETLPQSMKEVLEQHKLVFYDLNTLEFSGTLNKSDPEFKRLLKPELMQCAPCDRLYNPQAIHKVRFNPNKQAFSWLASGGAAGLTRLHLVKQVTPVNTSVEQGI